MTVPNPGAFAVPPQQPQSSAVNPAVPAGMPRPPLKPPLTREAAHRARLAGGVGGGIAWLGLAIVQVCVLLVLLPLGLAAVLLGVVLAWGGGAPGGSASILPELLPWLGSPVAIALMIGIPVGIVVSLLGLWLSTRMLRRPGIERPVAVTWAAFGISIVAASILNGLGSTAVSPFAGALPNVEFDGFRPMETPQIDPGVLADLADPDRLLALAWPFVVIATLASLVVQVAVSIFCWWWMAHAMRPATEPAEES